MNDSNEAQNGSSASERPVIGLTTYLERAQTGVWDVRASFLPAVYFEAVTAAGGIAVLLPPQPVDADIAHELLSRLDGLIICGGVDVDPARYGQQAHPLTDRPRTDRDALEDALLHAAISEEVPFLGICRGAQMLNVALGGTLNQHLPEVVGSDRYRAGDGVFNSVPVAVEQGSRLATIVGDNLAGVPVYHHQSIATVAQGLSVVARTDDGTIQAIELGSVPFGLAVQWHPEQTATEDSRLFAALVEAAANYKRNRS
ncbi:gamma-glutamyl-gamma-aminobutyrate hydrolase family protein [Lysinibacter cavernae]|uniref:Putative glutamine amidotransferase n=1 Tax=Lysinibacter cavernae TaxID=1640652 RepID=A0A7X5R1H7_9MICO|nr:gamma-glutamyl-gamma-aminobutyrate hydrolase family protein [Lysinibacter cavernae]NIH53881.1 putative glutamine amidotransferase [Lysinibacter cavernae]